MDKLPRENDDGSWSLMLQPCPTEVAADLLDPSVPFVWVVGHWPRRHLEWWDTNLQLAFGEPPSKVRVRNLQCDLLFRTDEFREVARLFDGITLYQMKHSVPNTLCIESLPKNKIVSILRQAGMTAHFHQPHSMEVAMYTSWSRDWMDHLLADESIAPLAF